MEEKKYAQTHTTHTISMDCGLWLWFGSAEAVRAFNSVHKTNITKLAGRQQVGRISHLMKLRSYHNFIKNIASAVCECARVSASERESEQKQRYTISNRTGVLHVAK